MPGIQPFGLCLQIFLPYDLPVGKQCGNWPENNVFETISHLSTITAK